MKRILLAIMLILALIAFCASSCDLTGNNNGPYQVCIYQIDYTTTRWERTVPIPAPDQITEGSTVTHLVKGTCHH
jgi:hypothetical protein